MKMHTLYQLYFTHLCTKFDHSSFSRFRDMVGAHKNLNYSSKWKTGWFGVVRGHSRSLKLASFDTVHRSSYLSVQLHPLLLEVCKYDKAETLIF